jgi:hypothetical protein
VRSSEGPSYFVDTASATDVIERRPRRVSASSHLPGFHRLGNLDFIHGALELRQFLNYVPGKPCLLAHHTYDIERLQSTYQVLVISDSRAVLLGNAPSEFSMTSTPLLAVQIRISTGLPFASLGRRPDIAAGERAMATELNLWGTGNARTKEDPAVPRLRNDFSHPFDRVSAVVAIESHSR